jgi:hypothetical protein
MPFLERVPLRLGLLHAILTEFALAERDRRFNSGDIVPLGDGDDSDGAWIAAALPGRARDAPANVLEARSKIGQ